MPKKGEKGFWEDREGREIRLTNEKKIKLKRRKTLKHQRGHEGKQRRQKSNPDIHERKTRKSKKGDSPFKICTLCRP